MHIFIKEYKDCLRQVFAQFTKEEVNKEYNEALVILQKKVQFPGYRVGKVPFEIIEKQKADDLMKSIVNNMVMMVAQKLHADGVMMYSEPRFKPLSGLTKDSAFSFSMVFDVVPQVIENVNIDTAVVEYDEYVYDDKMLEFAMKKDFSSLEAVTGKIEEKDTVTVKVLNEGFGDDNEKTFDSGVVKQIIGKKKGDKVELTFADLDSYVVDFLGKTPENQVSVEILKVERPSEQEVTDEFIKQVSVFKTVEEYKTSMKTRYDSMQKEFNDMNKRNALMTYIGKNAKVEFPKTDYVRDSYHEINQFLESNFYMSDISLKNLLEDKKIRDDFAALPEKIYENFVFVAAVRDFAQQNHIQPSSQTIDKIARNHAKEHSLSVEEYKLKATKEEWNGVLERARFEDTIDFLLGKVKFKSKSKQPLIKVK